MKQRYRKSQKESRGRRVHVVDRTEALSGRVAVELPISLAEVVGGLGEEIERLAGVHYGGVGLDARELKRFQVEMFPNAVHLSGYGNTLFGCCLELDVGQGRQCQYFAHGNRLVFGVLENQPSDSPDALCYDAIGREGQLIFSRLDRTFLIVNFPERDSGRLVSPPSGCPSAFERSGVETPHPLEAGRNRIAAQLY